MDKEPAYQLIENAYYLLQTIAPIKSEGWISESSKYYHSLDIYYCYGFLCYTLGEYRRGFKFLQYRIWEMKKGVDDDIIRLCKEIIRKCILEIPDFDITMTTDQLTDYAEQWLVEHYGRCDHDTMNEFWGFGCSGSFVWFSLFTDIKANPSEVQCNLSHRITKRILTEHTPKVIAWSQQHGVKLTHKAVKEYLIEHNVDWHHEGELYKRVKNM